MTTPLAVKRMTIHLKGDCAQKELEAGGTITPGHLITRNSSNKVVVHPTAKGNQNGMFAIENALKGKTIDDDYANTDRVQYVVCCQGCEVQAWLTTSQTIVVGDLLESNGNGDLKKHTPPVANSAGVFDAGEKVYAKGIVGIAIEAVTTTSARKRIAIEIV